jgi:hypothetical protein
MKGVASCLTVGALLLASPGFGQSLAELAKKEKERRERIARKGRSYSDRDLRGALPPPLTESTETPAEGQPTTAGSSSEASPEEAPPQEDPTKSASYWRERMGKIQQRISDLEGQLNAPGFSQDPANLARRQRIERDLERARADLQAVVDEARTQGVPPGWLR